MHAIAVTGLDQSGGGEVNLHTQPAVPIVMKTRSSQVLTTTALQLTAPSIRKSVVKVAEPAKQLLRSRVAAFRSKLMTNNEFLAAPTEEKRIFLRLSNLNLESLQGTGFDVHVTDNPQEALGRSDASLVGSIKLFNHPDPHSMTVAGRRGRATRGMRMMESHSQSFDVTRAVAATKNENLADLSVVLVPYSLVSSANREVVLLGTNAMKVGSIGFFLR